MGEVRYPVSLVNIFCGQMVCGKSDTAIGVVKNTLAKSPNCRYKLITNENSDQTNGSGQLFLGCLT
jgi:hypothetical protein